MEKAAGTPRTKLDTHAKAYLKALGLSKQAIKSYELLLVNGPLSARQAANYSKSFASAEYRLFYELEKRQLVIKLPGRPRRFEALAINDGLQASMVNHEEQLKQLLYFSDNATSDPLSIIVGRQKVYDLYAVYAKKAQRQICVYSIGIAYSSELAKTQAAAVKRGVSIRHVVQEVKAANYYVISRWLKLGIALRTLKRPRGYHLTIIDDSCAIVTFSNPKDTEQRLSMLTTDKNTISIFQSQFEDIWDSAKVLKNL